MKLQKQIPKGPFQILQISTTTSREGLFLSNINLVHIVTIKNVGSLLSPLLSSLQYNNLVERHQKEQSKVGICVCWGRREHRSQRRVSKALVWRKCSMSRAKRQYRYEKQPSKGCQSQNKVKKNSHGEGSQAQDVRIQAWWEGYTYRSTSQIGCQSQNGIKRVSIIRVVQNWMSKPEWNKEIREWGPVRSVGLYWASAWWEGGMF